MRKRQVIPLFIFIFGFLIATETLALVITMDNYWYRVEKQMMPNTGAINSATGYWHRCLRCDSDWVYIGSYVPVSASDSDTADSVGEELRRMLSCKNYTLIQQDSNYWYFELIPPDPPIVEDPPLVDDPVDEPEPRPSPINLPSSGPIQAIDEVIDEADTALPFVNRNQITGGVVMIAGLLLYRGMSKKEAG